MWLSCVKQSAREGRDSFWSISKSIIIIFNWSTPNILIIIVIDLVVVVPPPLTLPSIILALPPVRTGCEVWRPTTSTYWLPTTHQPPTSITNNLSTVGWHSLTLIPTDNNAQLSAWHKKTRRHCRNGLQFCHRQTPHPPPCRWRGRVLVWPRN